MEDHTAVTLESPFPYEYGADDDHETSREELTEYQRRGRKHRPRVREHKEALVDEILDHYNPRQCTTKVGVRDRYLKHNLAKAATRMGMKRSSMKKIDELCDFLDGQLAPDHGRRENEDEEFIDDEEFAGIDGTDSLAFDVEELPDAGQLSRPSSDPIQNMLNAIDVRDSSSRKV